MKHTVIGAGSWGTALAMILSKRSDRVMLYTREIDQAEEIRSSRMNSAYLPKVELPEALEITTDLEEAVKGASTLVMAVPSQAYRSVAKAIAPYLTGDELLIDVAKGIELGTLMTMSQVTEDVLGKMRYVVLSGPSHAEEVAIGLPTTLVAASEHLADAEIVQDLFTTDCLRVYTNPDVIGVELGGSLKNIIALGAGISDGMGFGDNAKAALMTRGIVEITRLGVALGGKPETFQGLSGIGDLIVTCTSMHSRNRRCGILIGEGKPVAEAVETVGMVVEGFYTVTSAYELARSKGVEMPITEELYGVIHEGKSAAKSVRNLMMREPKHETESVLF